MQAYAIEAFIFLTVISFLFYRWATAHYRTFTRRNVKHVKPIPLVGNTLPMFLGKQSMYKLLINLHEQFKTEQIYGYYNIRDPIFVIRDPELIKKIAIKDFDHFPNHNSSAATKDDKVIGKMLNMMRDQKWKDMRATLTPVFTGSKMREIFQLVNECSSEAVKSLLVEVKAEGTEMQFKDFFSRYTNDVIASAAFGVQVNSYRDKENKFYTMSTQVLKFRFFAFVKLLIMMVFPQVGKFVKLKVIDQEALIYLQNIVVETIKHREKNNIVRQDMIHLLMEAQKNGQTASNSKWTDDEIIAQCLLFFFAGLETVSNMLCFTAHELMKNPEIQERLYEEVTEMNTELNGERLTYDSVKKMKYLNMVVSESLRKWPPAIVTDRVCSKPYTLTDDAENVVAEFKTGDNVWFSILGSHYDPDNFPDPYVFNPERFSDENKDAIKPYTYLPFGVGPRNCIANRFGLMEAKAILYYLVLNFKFAAGPNATPELMEAIKGFQITPETLFRIKLIPRHSN